MQKLLVCAALLASIAGCGAPTRQDTPLAHGSGVRFATRTDGAAILSERDDFVMAMSGFDRSARLKTREEVSVDRYLGFAAGEALEWGGGETAGWTEALREVARCLEPWRLPFPSLVSLVKTSGKEEGGAAYTRGTAICLPQRIVSESSGEGRRRLLLHELFHVLSRNAPELRLELYRIVGFEEGTDIELPPHIARVKITNPDAPRVNVVMELEREGAKLHFAPILLSRSEAYDPDLGGEFFNYMQHKMIAVESKGGRWVSTATGAEGAPRLFDPHELEGFDEKIGRNTGYILHPDEILADNFVLLVTGVEPRNVPTPRILEEMRRALERHAGNR